MKIGFSSLVCPEWDLETTVTKASELGFDGVELRGLRGELHLPAVPEVARDTDGVRAFLDEKGIELVCLGSSVTLDACDRRELARQKEAVTEYLELAHRLSCPYVRVFAGYVQKRDNRRRALVRISEAIRSLIPVSSRLGVSLLIENGGDFPGSDDMWFVLDTVGHPAVQACWNQCNALVAGERATISIPRLGLRIGAVHICDATFDQQGVLESYKALGTGDAETDRQIELLRGIAYDKYLIWEWPKLWTASLPNAEEALPGIAEYLRERRDAKQAVLTAYKGDKRPPRLASRDAAAGA